MRFDRTRSLILLWIFYTVMWVGGSLRLHDPGWGASVFLFTAGAIALVSEGEAWKQLLAIGAVGFAFECLGVHTGIPFGPYNYTDALQPIAFGVPIVIAAAWMAMFAFVRQFRSNIWLAAGLLTATDLLIDPVASGVLGYWRWQAPGWYFGVPASNFVGWYLVGWLMFRMTSPSQGKNWSQRALGLSILLFFVARAST